MARIAITARIDALLMQKNITKAQFYEECGITSASYSQWNTGKTTPRMKNIIRIAEYLKVSPEYLLTGEQIKKEPTSISESELIEGSAKQKLIDLILNDDISEDQAQAWITLIESVKNNRLN